MSDFAEVGLILIALKRGVAAAADQKPFKRFPDNSSL
jgi:hypothetical protein